MVFTTKLSQPQPPSCRSAYRLASELGVGVEDIMATLNELGHYVASPRTHSIESVTARDVADRLGRTLVAEPTKPVTPWELKPTNDKPHKPARSRRPASLASKPPRTRFIPPDKSLGLGSGADDASPSFDQQSWQLYGFSDAERDAWVAQGLRTGQAKLARYLRDAGLMASQLGIEVEGWTVAKRLRAGDSVRYILGLLERQQPDRDAG